MKKSINNQPWYKEAIIYQLHVKTFYDSDGDGVGDFRGLTEKLSYLKDLGVTAVWLLPFYPSPLKDDGYDIADYYDVNPQYGTLRDFKDFLRKAHSLDLKVITELVINHTSDQHRWFKRAKESKPGSKYRDYYVWSDTYDKYQDARIIFKDFEHSNWTWDDQAGAYYWHRFYSHQPDLNFENLEVQKAIFRAMDFWFAMGVDGMRLDAIPYLYEEDGSNCENLPQTHAFLQKLRKRLDNKFKDKMLLAEANQWPEDAAAYFGKGEGDECHMAFHFPLMPRMYMAVQMENRFPIIDILEQTPEIPSLSQWAIFLRNHDELTLEMVTDDERDYMYRTYAQDDRSKINLGIRRRLCPLLGKNRRKIELMNILLFSLPGTPVIYYGDEINMGDNRFLGDRDGVRTPMQWSPDRNAGFSKANSQQLYLPVIVDSEYHYETVNVETEDTNLSSMLWWMRRVIAMRRRFKSLSCGDIKFLRPDNTKVLAFTRNFEDETILVVMNLSRFSQSVKLSLNPYVGYVPEEVFSQNNFETITEEPYVMTLNPHAHFWLILNKQELDNSEDMKKSITECFVEKKWHDLFLAHNITSLADNVLKSYLPSCRWFGGKSNQITEIKIKDVFALSSKDVSARLLIVHVVYSDKDSEDYLLPVCFSYMENVAELLHKNPQSVICALTVAGKRGLVYDATYDSNFQKQLLNIIADKKKLKSGQSFVRGYATKELKKIMLGCENSLRSELLTAEQSNTSIVFEELFFMKLFRKVEVGLNPDIEISRYLSEQKLDVCSSEYIGHIEYSKAKEQTIGLVFAQKRIEAVESAWDYVLANLKEHFDTVILSSLKSESVSSVSINSLFLDMVALLAHRTAQMHLALAANTSNPDFKPEAFTMLYQRSVFQAMGSQLRYVFGQIKKHSSNVPADIRDRINEVLACEINILNTFKSITKEKISAKKIRIHGDYHLGQALFTGKDFAIIDFEGEPSRPLSERRLKSSALKDLAGMIRSFHYAAYAAILLNDTLKPSEKIILEKSADEWYEQTVRVYISAYFKTLGKVSFLPKSKSELSKLLQIYLLDKAVYELGYELNNRPDWLIVPLRGIKQLLNNPIF